MRTISSNVVKRCCFSDSAFGLRTIASSLLVMIVIELGMFAPSLVVVVVVGAADAGVDADSAS